MTPSYISIILYIQLIIWLGPYDFSDVENMDGIVKSSHKNGIYCIMWNVTEFVTLWINQKLVNQIAIWTSICEY